MPHCALSAKTRIGDEEGEGLIHYCRWEGLDAAEVLVKLLPLTDEQVLSVLTVIAAACLDWDCEQTLALDDLAGHSIT